MMALKIEFLVLFCHVISRLIRLISCIQAEAAFDAKDYERAASFYAKVHLQY